MDTLIPNTFILNDFINDTSSLLNNLLTLDYDKSINTRWTASFGVPYEYSGKTYPATPMPDFIESLIPDISKVIGFTPNNCLVNLYHDGNSTMGYHSDNTDVLEIGTGVAILSVGSIRTLRFKNKADRENIIDYNLTDGSLLYMDDTVQNDWLHSIPRSNNIDVRISLTFRNIL